MRPFEPLDGDRARSALFVVVRLVADHLYRGAALERGNGVAVVVRGAGVVVEAIHIAPSAVVRPSLPNSAVRLDRVAVVASYQRRIESSVCPTRYPAQSSKRRPR